MNKIERMEAVLAGKKPDRPPFSLWYHFGNQHASGEFTAQTHLEFYKSYDPDILKVMNDYDYPMPKGLETVATVEDLKRIEPVDMTKSPMGEQLKALEIIAKKLDGEAWFVDTIFNAQGTLKRYLAKGALLGLMENHPEEVLSALEIINQNLIQYAIATIDRGAAGIFFSVPATTERISREHYEQFMRPFDFKLLEALSGKGKCHILHAHGENLFFDRMLDYPVHVLSWADLNGGPSIEEAKKQTDLPLMAGVDHVRFPDLTAPEMRAQVAEAIRQAGDRGLIVAPGCAVPTWSFTPMYHAVREALTY